MIYTIILTIAWVVIGIGHVVKSWLNDGSPYRDPYFNDKSPTACIFLMVVLWPVCYWGDE